MNHTGAAMALRKKVSRAEKPEKESTAIQKVSRALSPFEEMESIMDRMDHLFDEYLINVE